MLSSKIKELTKKTKEEIKQTQKRMSVINENKVPEIPETKIFSEAEIQAGRRILVFYKGYKLYQKNKIFYEKIKA